MANLKVNLTMNLVRPFRIVLENFSAQRANSKEPSDFKFKKYQGVAIMMVTKSNRSDSINSKTGLKKQVWVSHQF